MLPTSNTLTPERIAEIRQKAGLDKPQNSFSGGGTAQPPMDYESRIKMLETPVQKPGQKKAIPDEAHEGFLEKADKTFGKVFEPASDFMFGTAAKTIGNTIGQGVEAVQGKDGVFTKGFNEQFGDINVAMHGEKQPENSAPISNTLMTALELWPGGKAAGGVARKTLAAAPGGERLMSAMEKLFDHIPKKLKDSALKQYAAALHPTTGEMKTVAQEVAPEMLNRGITFKTPEALADKASTAANTAGEKIGSFFNDLPDHVKTVVDPVMEKLKGLKNKYIIDGKVMRPEAVNAIQNVEDKVNELALGNVADKTNEVGMKNLRQLRQIFDEHFVVGKDMSDISAYTKKAERAAGDSIRAELAKDSPDLASLNKEFSFWQSVKDLAETSAKREFGKNGRVMSHALGGIIGGELGHETGNTTAGTLIGTFLGPKAAEYIRSPAWKSVSAVTKNKLADYIASGKAKEAALLMSKAMEGVKNLAE